VTESIRLESLGKKYTKLEERAMLLRSLLPFARPRRSDFWALRGIDLAVERGETVGVIGRNGAGKTTLLRLLAGVSTPTEGRLRVHGRVAPLISVGVGFHREMSGRENVYVNGMLLGLTKKEVDERFDDIVRFAELSDFIDTPVKFYSSGMFMRLGFAVAINIDPQVLLVDEVLAVGDANFQAKCFDRMAEIQRSGTTIVLVSHSMQAIRRLCPRALLISAGHLVFDGDTAEAIARHYELLSVEPQAVGLIDPHELSMAGGVAAVHQVLVGPDGPVHYVERGADLSFDLALRFDVDADSPLFNFTVIDDEGSIVYGAHSPIGETHHTFRTGDEAVVRFAFKARLAGGTYRIIWAVNSWDTRALLATNQNGVQFFVAKQQNSYGKADLEGSVIVDDEAIYGQPMGLPFSAPDRASE
jgi:ABC-type polysaccharide/polyol phosphate transport system ATPase subunit